MAAPAQGDQWLGEQRRQRVDDDGPVRRTRLDHGEVVAVRLDEASATTRVLRRGDVRAALRERDAVVGARVNAQHLCRQRDAPDRVGNRIPIRQVRGDPPTRSVTAVPPTPFFAAVPRSSTPACETAAVTATTGSAPGAPAGSRARPAAHTARCPPAECPTVTTREVSTSRWAR